MGAPQAAVWALMVWDAVVVGLIACWTGTALGIGYRGGHPDGESEPLVEPLPIR